MSPETSPEYSFPIRRSTWPAPVLFRQASAKLERLAMWLRRWRDVPRPWRRRLRRQLAATMSGAALLLALVANPVQAAAITVVNGEVAIANNGKCSLREAIINANNNNRTHADCASGSGAFDVITLPWFGDFSVTESAGTWYGSPTGLPLITSGIYFQANGSTIRRAASARFRLFALSPGAGMTLDYATISNGHSNATGGAIHNEQGYLYIHYSTLSANKAESYGGAVHHEANASGQPYQYAITGVSYSTFRANESMRSGGAISSRLNDSDASYNNVHIEQSTFEGNRAAQGGGALRLNGVNARVHATTISGNNSQQGGGISVFYADLTIADSTLSDNDGGAVDGGAIYAVDTHPMLIYNSTLSGNSADLAGGGIYATRT